MAEAAREKGVHRLQELRRVNRVDPKRRLPSCSGRDGNTYASLRSARGRMGCQRSSPQHRVHHQDHRDIPRPQYAPLPRRITPAVFSRM
jgi:hypothetical protein